MSTIRNSSDSYQEMTSSDQSPQHGTGLNDSLDANQELTVTSSDQLPQYGLRVNDNLNSLETNDSYPNVTLPTTTPEESQKIPRSFFADNVDVHQREAANEYIDASMGCCLDPSSEDDDGFSLVKNIDYLDSYLNYDEIDVRSDEEESTVNHALFNSPSQHVHAEEETQHHHKMSFDPHHQFDAISRHDTISFQIMSLLDAAGAPLYCYDQLLSLLKKAAKEDGFNVKKLISRDTLMAKLVKCKQVPTIQTTVLHKQPVLRFVFKEMLQELLHTAREHLHIIVPKLDTDEVIPPETGTEHELWNTPYMERTFLMEPYHQFDPKTDIMLPLIMYMDKTGTDVNQRYPLEPLLFSLAAIPRQQRQNRRFWRHLGFIPQRKGDATADETSSSLQVYHDFLSYLLDGIRDAQRNPPTVLIRSKSAQGGIAELVERKAFLPLMLVMGDQLSQDTLCGRLKSNSGGAGRVHRSCMCSYLHIDDPSRSCQKVDPKAMKCLSTYANRSDKDVSNMMDILPSAGMSLSSKESKSLKSFLMKQRNMFRSILRHPYTTHTIKNAFEGMQFGSWSTGIHEATFDDFMHGVEAGMIAYVTEAVYDGLTQKERETVEQYTRRLLDGNRSSVSSDYPRWRLQHGFTRQTLMTSGERVGSILILCLSLQDPVVKETIQSGHSRQILKYLDLSTETPLERNQRETDSTSGQKHKKPPPPPPAPEIYLKQHMHTLDDRTIQHTLEQMRRHEFSFEIMEGLDQFQINQMVWHCSELFQNTKYPKAYPTESIDGLYTDHGTRPVIPRHIFNLVKQSMQTHPDKLIDSYRRRTINGTTPKHLLRKVNKKGEGSSAAVLTSNMDTLIIFLEYLLAYHAFCKYSWTLPYFLQQQHENIKFGNEAVVEYFLKLIYRGNNSVDSRFPKLHSQCRMAVNTFQLNTVMHVSCETGERLLKTEAKGISRTAQQRGQDSFLSQTMLRLQDRSISDSFAFYLENKNKEKVNNRIESHEIDPTRENESSGIDRPGRIHPHFIYNNTTDSVVAVDRKNTRRPPDRQSGFLDVGVRQALRKHHPQVEVFQIYNEIVLRNDSRLRASPNHATTGPWYDFANVSWNEEIIDPTTKEVVNTVTYLLPAKCLCFYTTTGTRTTTTITTEEGAIELMALVHSVDQKSKGKVPGRSDTLLTENYFMEYKRGEPVTYVVPVAAMDHCIQCFPHSPTQETIIPKPIGILCLLPRNHWAYIWMAMNDILKDASHATDSSNEASELNPLCEQEFLQKVRDRYRIVVNAKNIEDLQYRPR